MKINESVSLNATADEREKGQVGAPPLPPLRRSCPVSTAVAAMASALKKLDCALLLAGGILSAAYKSCGCCPQCRSWVDNDRGVAAKRAGCCPWLFNNQHSARIMYDTIFQKWPSYSSWMAAFVAGPNQSRRDPYNPPQNKITFYAFLLGPLGGRSTSNRYIVAPRQPKTPSHIIGFSLFRLLFLPSKQVKKD